MIIDRARQRFSCAEPGVLLGRGVRDGLVATVARLQQHGAALLCGGAPAPGPGYRFANTLLEVSGERFLEDPQAPYTQLLVSSVLQV